MSESEKFSLATHVHVRLRRANGRVVDAVWMAHNDDYAREIIGIARSIRTDAELQSLCDRFEALMGIAPVRRPAPAARVTTGGAVDSGTHYVGTLR
jgi:hypothetical protein